MGEGGGGGGCSGLEKKLDSDSYKQLSHIACPGPLVSRLS